MQFVASIPLKNTIQCLWVRDEVTAHTQDPLWKMEFAQIAIGVSLETPYFGAVAGLRRIEKKRGTSQYAIILDEFEAPIAQDLAEWCISTKDRYAAPVLFCPSTPLTLCESLRATRGLTWYPEELTTTEAKQLWPHFFDKERTIGFRQVTAPDDETLHRDMEKWLTEEVTDPTTLRPLLGEDGQPINRLQLPENLPTSNCRAALRTATRSPALAAWMALSALEKTTFWSEEDDEEYEHQTTNPTGY